MTERADAAPRAPEILANRRTFLASLRTTLGLLAGGIALGLVDVQMEPVPRFVAAVLLIGAGALTPLGAWFEWRQADRALRNNADLSTSWTTAATAMVVSVVALLLLATVVLRGP